MSGFRIFALRLRLTTADSLNSSTSTRWSFKIHQISVFSFPKTSNSSKHKILLNSKTIIHTLLTGLSFKPFNASVLLTDQSYDFHSIV